MNEFADKIVFRVGVIILVALCIEAGYQYGYAEGAKAKQCNPTKEPVK